jgi:hypothetical protein
VRDCCYDAGLPKGLSAVGPPGPELRDLCSRGEAIRFDVEELKSLSRRDSNLP